MKKSNDNKTIKDVVAEYLLSQKVGVIEFVEFDSLNKQQVRNLY